MSKKETNNFYTLGILLLGLSLILYSCKDDYLQNQEVDNTDVKFKITTINYKTAIEQSRFIKINTDLKLNKYVDKNKLTTYLNKSSIDTLGITIYTDVIKQIEYEEYTSYTMLISKDSINPKSFYNLTIEQKDTISQMFIVNYQPTDYWLDNKNEVFQGVISARRTNPINLIVETDGSYGGIGAVPYDPFTDTCEGQIIETTIAIPYPCGCGHMPDNPWHAYCDASPHHPGYNYETTYECIPDPFWNGNNNPDNPNNGNNTGTNNGNDDNDSDQHLTSLSSLVDPEGNLEKIKTPCETLNDLTDPTKANAKQKIEALKNSINTTGESGFQLEKDSNGNYSNPDIPPTATNTIQIKSKGNFYGAGHNHPSISTFPMYTWGDLNVLRNLYRWAKPNVRGEVTFILASQDFPAVAEVYAIKVVDYLAFRNKMNGDLANIVNELDDLDENTNLEDRIDALNDKKGEGYEQNNNYEQVFLEQFTDYNISLYKANSDLTDWSELTLDPTFGTVIETPCN